MGRVYSEILAGKSLGRALVNDYLSGLELTGDILDLGSGESHGSHERAISYREPYTLTHTDFHRVSKGVRKLDLEAPFKLKKKYDAITCFNVLEHVYDYRNVLRESHKALKGGGLFIASTPFLVRHHPAPQDYWRFSESALGRMLKDEGFEILKIEGLGYGPFSASQWVSLLPKPLRLCTHMVHISLDGALGKIRGIQWKAYPVVFVITARKNKG